MKPPFEIDPLKLSEDAKRRKITLEDVRPDWTRECSSCGAKPVVPVTGLCGVCTWGDPECAGGNW